MAATSSSSSVYLGVTRSRTLLFLSYRDSATRDHSSWDRNGTVDANGEDEYGDDQALIGKGKGVDRRKGAYYDASGELQEHGDELSYPPRPSASTSYSTQLPPKWVDISDEVDAILASIKPKMAQLDRLHAKHILPGFADRSGEEREIERETTEITKQFRKCSKLISGMAQHTQSLSRSGRASAHEIAMANNVQTALATKVQDASGTFRRKQSNYMQRLRGHEERHQAGHMPDSETAMREDMELSRQHLERSRSQQDQLQAQSQLLIDEEQAQAPSQSEIDIVRRDREIDQIAKSITELAELFQDLSALVIDQGTMLDRIDFNIEHIGQDMAESVKELNQATSYQRRTSRGQCILFLILLILLTLAIIIVKPFWR
ncbi:t-SNARE [Meira miltonrushii]|uniref:t-SNARE n=1 Tax=Meira miltonrushii TaxID=1280837 RepID=A0A316VAM5_9BASI|nr:t-SNARE [Meira miltonrushii]PWN32575.1 t-SNARE [Meira miltonrushii]